MQHSSWIVCEQNPGTKSACHTDNTIEQKENMLRLFLADSVVTYTLSRFKMTDRNEITPVIYSYQSSVSVFL